MAFMSVYPPLYTSKSTHKQNHKIDQIGAPPVLKQPQHSTVPNKGSQANNSTSLIPHIKICYHRICASEPA